MIDKKKIINRIEKVEFVIKNWNKYSVAELSKKLEIAPSTISQWASRLRRKGVNIPRKDSGEISWKYLQNKYAKK